MNEEELNQRVAELEAKVKELEETVKEKDEAINRYGDELSTTRSARDIFYDQKQKLEQSTEKKMKQISLAVNLLSELVE